MLYPHPQKGGYLTALLYAKKLKGIFLKNELKMAGD